MQEAVYTDCLPDLDGHGPKRARRPERVSILIQLSISIIHDKMGMSSKIVKIDF